MEGICELCELCDGSCFDGCGDCSCCDCSGDCCIGDCCDCDCCDVCNCDCACCKNCDPFCCIWVPCITCDCETGCETIPHSADIYGNSQQHETEEARNHGGSTSTSTKRRKRRQKGKHREEEEQKSGPEDGLVSHPNPGGWAVYGENGVVSKQPSAPPPSYDQAVHGKRDDRPQCVAAYADGPGDWGNNDNNCTDASPEVHSQPRDQGNPEPGRGMHTEQPSKW